MTELDPRKKWPRSKWVGPLLTASIIINVFLAGFVVARLGAPQSRQSGEENRPVIQMSLRSLPQDMPREVRERLEDEISDRQDELDDAYRDLQRAQTRAFTLLGEDNFDREAVEAAFDEMRHLQEQVQVYMNEAMIDAARQMSAESRRYFARDDLRRTRTIRRTDRVDGGRWRFSLDDQGIELNLEALEELGLENLADMRIVIENLDQFDDFDEDDWWDDEEYGDEYEYYYDDDEEDDDEDDDPDGGRRNWPIR